MHIIIRPKPNVLGNIRKNVIKTTKNLENLKKYKKGKYFKNLFI